MVSVIIPVYNAEKTLARAIKSVLNQFFVSQLIIVNDASTDDSLSIIAFFRTTYFFPNGDIKLDLLSLDDSKGVSMARNLGLECVTSPLVSFLDADDEFLPGRFYENVLQLIENKEIELDFVYPAMSNNNLFDNIFSLHLHKQMDLYLTNPL